MDASASRTTVSAGPRLDGTGRQARLLDDLPAAIFDLQHAEGREVEAEVILGRHSDGACGADETLGAFDGIADIGRLGAAGMGQL